MKAIRRSRGTCGSRRKHSTHIVIAMKWVVKIRCRRLVCGVRIIGSTDTTIGNSRIALTVTAIAACTTVAPEPSVEIRMICAGPGPDQCRAGQHPSQAEMGVVRQRADAEIGRKQHQSENGRGDRAHAPCERARGALPFWRIERGKRHGHPERVNCDGHNAGETQPPRQASRDSPAALRFAPVSPCHSCFAARGRRRRRGGYGCRDRRRQGACRRRSAPDRTCGCRGCATSCPSRLGSWSPITALSRFIAREYIASARSRLKPAASCTPHCCAGAELHMLLQLGDEGIGRALQQRHQFAGSSTLGARSGGLPLRAAPWPSPRPSCR